MIRKRGPIILFLVMIFSWFFSSGCQPSESAVQTAIAQTQNVLPTATDIAIPPETPTNTPEPTPTETITPTATATYTTTPDLRIIETGPEEFLLESKDLPSEAKYFLPNSGWISPHRNSEVVSQWGREAGLEYIETTGRLDGWFAYFQRGTSIVRAPDQIFHNIIQFETSEGARLAMEVENPNDTVEYKIIDEDYELGDLTVISSYREMQPSGDYQIVYLVETLYKNYESRIGGMGREKEFDLEYVIKIAEIALDKLKEAQLVNP